MGLVKSTENGYAMFLCLDPWSMHQRGTGDEVTFWVDNIRF